MLEQNRCFVIGPIGDRLADVGTPGRQAYEDAIQVWEKVILPACEAAGLNPLRADHISRTGEIVDQVCRHLRDANLVIADLTGANPNVMYELGLRHTINLPTIQLGERGRLPFDISAIRTIQFKRSEAGFIDAREQLLRAIQTGLTEGGDPVTATRAWNDLPHTAEPSTGLPDILEDDEPGFLEKLADSEAGLETMKSIVEGMTEVLGNIGSIADLGAEEFKRVDASGGKASARLAVAERTAKRLDEQGATLEALAQEFEDSISRIDPGIDYLLQQLESDSELRQKSAVFAESLCQLAQATENNRPVSASFQQSMMSVGAASRSMRKAATRINQALERQQGAGERFDEWRDRIRRMGFDC